MLDSLRTGVPAPPAPAAAAAAPKAGFKAATFAPVPAAPKPAAAAATAPKADAEPKAATEPPLLPLPALRAALAPALANCTVRAVTVRCGARVCASWSLAGHRRDSKRHVL